MISIFLILSYLSFFVKRFDIRFFAELFSLEINVRIFWLCISKKIKITLQIKFIMV